MVFKRRDKRPIWQVVVDFFYPKGGWKRAFYYVQHRLHRLPDPPHRIARGLFIGVLISFTPLFGMHFIFAALLAKAIRGNIMAALLGTFFGNPLTFPFIATLSLQLGYLIMGYPHGDPHRGNVFEYFKSSGIEIKRNFVALFTDADANWSSLSGFYESIFLPYLIGGIVPGVVCGLVVYYLSVPLITVYQNRRRGRLKKKLDELRKKAAKKADGEV
ncbi:DUF2062 domain-containing protein [Halocynthiibacter sp. C4]|uniref:DUF2062 domain-containing protein n=1 Tax=Halocynthiibacter sp. C4 TaxID=2992758 RepID=UPI00237C14A7|nr:DUF2062 domain-containing protein [Halocynthiibacter sp. C4]MDE0590775.1 DUF2062 domain-containing protein [Halocynthiibacter sp. C4]